MKKFDESLSLRSKFQGEGHEDFIKVSNEIAIVCNILSMSYLQKENFQVAQELLKKAESMCDGNERMRAVTFNNYACLFRRTKKLRSALTYLEKALEIEYRCLNYSEETVDECLTMSSPSDIHLNICAILSQMGKHELALQHSMKALILIQDELVARVEETTGDRETKLKTHEERMIVLCIAYHNIAVEQEFLK